MQPLSVSVLLFVDSGLKDQHLTFKNHYLPDFLSEKIQESGIIDNIYVTVHETYSGKLEGYPRKIVREDSDDIEFWKKVFSETDSSHVVKINGDSPFIDLSIIEEMAGIHTEYLAEFTYSENLPSGLTCEIVSRELIDNIPDFDEKTLPLFQVIKSNINQFDIELYYRDPDIRDKRIEFRCSSPRDKIIMENIYDIQGGVPKYENIRDIINENPGLLYIGPSYLELELTGACDYDCIFCYRKTLDNEHGNMETGLFEKILNNMGEFNLPYTICFGGSGEPLMHPNFYEIAQKAVDDPLVDRLIMETNGLYAGSNFLNFLMGENSGKITAIININGYDSETFMSLHGADHFNEVVTNIESLVKLNEKREQIYLQIMKINETEPFIDHYYDFWESRNLPIILQKQNTFLGRITDRRYSDLSPLDRIPCWHLQRDIYILSDGSVGFCKQDVDGQFRKGNLEKNTLKEIWESKRGDFIKDYKKDYSRNPDCESCDEWYTYNF